MGWSWEAPQNHVPPAEIVTLAIRDRVLCEEGWVENTVKISSLPPRESGLYYKYFETGKGTTQRLFCTSYTLETLQVMAVVGRRGAAKAKGGWDI